MSVTDPTENLCSVCLDEDRPIYQPTDNTCYLSCGHKFHSNCLLKWFVRNKTCPCCRALFSVCQHGQLENHLSEDLADVVHVQNTELKNLRAKNKALKADLVQHVEQLSIFTEARQSPPLTENDFFFQMFGDAVEVNLNDQLQLETQLQQQFEARNLLRQRFGL